MFEENVGFLFKVSRGRNIFIKSNENRISFVKDFIFDPENAIITSLINFFLIFFKTKI
jgi:hypothetical protein